jgi:virulence-associated protein VapD
MLNKRAFPATTPKNERTRANELRKTTNSSSCGVAYRNIRNDLAHCGFGRAEGQVLSATSICQNAEEVVKQVERLARQEFER